MAATKAPAGAKSDKLWRDALMRAVHREAEQGKPTKRLEALADKIVAKGLEGDIQAIKEIGDRLDGRPAQALEHSTPEGMALVIGWMTPEQAKARGLA